MWFCKRKLSISWGKKTLIYLIFNFSWTDYSPPGTFYSPPTEAARKAGGKMAMLDVLRDTLHN